MTLYGGIAVSYVLLHQTQLVTLGFSGPCLGTTPCARLPTAPEAVCDVYILRSPRMQGMDGISCWNIDSEVTKEPGVRVFIVYTKQCEVRSK